MRQIRGTMNKAALVIAALMTVASVTSSVASADVVPDSSFGCTGIHNVASCVRVKGSGEYVDFIRGGVQIYFGVGQVRGYNVVWSSAKSFKKYHTPIYTCHESHPTSTKCLSTKHNIGRKVKKGSNICASWVTILPSGRTVTKPPACENIE